MTPLDSLRWLCMESMSSLLSQAANGLRRESREIVGFGVAWAFERSEVVGSQVWVGWLYLLLRDVRVF